MAAVTIGAKDAPRKPVIIYGLADPRDEKIRYVGKTDDPVVRLRLHIWEASRNDTRKSLWLRTLAGDGIKPAMITLEVVPAGTDWGEVEKRHIALLKQAGADLLNETSGGQGVPDDARGKKWRAAIAASHIDNPRRAAGAKKAAEKMRGRKHSPETLAKMSAALKGRKLSADHVAKMSARHKGKTISAEHIERLRQALTGRPLSREHREKIKARWADPEYREKVLASRRRARESQLNRNRPTSDDVGDPSEGDQQSGTGKC